MSKHSPSTLTIILSLILNLSALADTNVRVARTFTGKELGNSTYTSFCRDAFGFMWIGTENGLIKFDGDHYQTYRHLEGYSESISDNRILGLLCDGSNHLWVATANGLNLYEESKDSFRRISVPDFGENGYIISITSEESGKITFVVSGVGIYELTVNENREITVNRIDIIESLKYVNCIMSHKDGRLYAGTNKGELFVFDYFQKWKKLADLESPIFDLSQESAGSLLLNTFKGIYRYSPNLKTLTHIRIDSKFPVNNFSTAVIGDVVYVATYGAGVWVIGNNSEEAQYCNNIYSPFIDIKDSRIGAVYGTSDGTLWIGCDFSGVLMVPTHGNSFLYRSLSYILKDYDVPIIAMDIWHGNTIIGNSVGEIAVISEDGQVLKEAVIPGSTAITSIDVTDEDTAILGVIGSGVWELNLINGKIIKKYDIPERYLSIEVCVADDKALYIGLYGKGLLKYDATTGATKWLSHDSDGKRLISPFITTIKSYGDRIWIGSYGGLACYNTSTGNFEDIDQAPYMACAVFDIALESENVVLIGTSNGLIRYNKDTKETKIFTTLNGLSDNEVRSIAIDCKGRRWIGTMNGINCWLPEDDSFVAYTGGNGMVERTFVNMAYSDANNMIYASGRMGLTSFNPDSITVLGFDNPLKVSSIYLKGKKISPEETHGFPDVIHLSHNENSIAIRISPMDFRDTSNLKYLWRFAGDNDWEVLPEGSDIINLSSLAPGKYTLEFKAEEAGIESPVSVLRINVAHPWYLTWIAKTIYVLLIVIMLTLAAILIRKRHQERINEQKMQFFMDMSHDMRSPLTLILGPLESLLKEKLRGDVRTRIRGVYRNAYRILNIVNQLLDLKKIDYGKKRLECSKTNISQFIAAIVEMFQPQAKDKGIILSFDSKMGINEIWIDRSVLDRILVNLISNAIKYTPENGKVNVLVTESHTNKMGNCIKISVVDSGIGVDSDSRTKIFSRYYRSENGEEYSLDGFGIGLDICKRYVRLHHGEIYLENKKDGDRGSVFTILIPVDENKYRSGELMIGNKDSVSDTMSEGVLDSAGVQEMTKRRRNIYAGCSVLVVEDDRHLLESICNFFKNYYNVYSAIDGVEGYKLAQELNPDVIITDVKMPSSDGLQLLRQLKFNETTKHIPVVILSSKSELSDRMAGWQQGAEAYIGKPFDFNELKAIVYNLIDGRKKLEKKAPVLEEPKLKACQSSMNLKGNDESLMERINIILDEKIEKEDMNVDRLAEELGVSRTHLYRRLKERYGINPSDYIRNKRLQRACELLKNDDLDITQIAYALGFSSQSQFSTTFKQFMGYTPTEFRLKHTEDTKSDMEFKS